MREFCHRFGLRYSLKYSSILTQEEINAMNLIGSHELRRLLSDSNKGYAETDMLVDKKLKRLSGMGNIEGSNRKLLMEAADTKHRDRVSVYLRHNKKLFELLSSARDKIVKYKLAGTVPMPQTDPIRSFLRRREAFSMMVHESIHYVLEKNGVDFGTGGLSPLDEGFCVFLHLRFGKSVGLYRNDSSELAKKYRLWASFFRELLKSVPDKNIVKTIKTYPTKWLERMIKNYEKKCGTGEI